jgi:hypothetical protein
MKAAEYAIDIARDNKAQLFALTVLDISKTRMPLVVTHMTVEKMVIHTTLLFRLIMDQILKQTHALAQNKTKILFLFFMYYHYLILAKTRNKYLRF